MDENLGKNTAALPYENGKKSHLAYEQVLNYEVHKVASGFLTLMFSSNTNRTVFVQRGSSTLIKLPVAQMENWQMTAIIRAFLKVAVNFVGTSYKKNNNKKKQDNYNKYIFFRSCMKESQGKRIQYFFLVTHQGKQKIYLKETKTLQNHDQHIYQIYPHLKDK